MKQYNVVLSRQFKKDMKKFIHIQKIQQEIQNVVGVLEKGQKLAKKYKNHELKGNLSGKYECHIRPDILLIYRYVENELLLVLLRVGNHSKLFS